VTAEGSRKHATGWLSLLVEYGPLLIFFIAYKTSGILVGTGAFMVAISVSLLVQWFVLPKVSPMTWLSAVLVIGFGGLTLYFDDPRYIQLKPTLIYSAFAIILFGGLLFGKSLLQYILGPTFEGLDSEGWLKLSRNWAIFFAAMAILNEAMRAYLTFDTWLTVKVWGVTILSLIFGMANMPMLMRHGFSVTDVKEEPPVPPQG
jgi:intracellular septation protein